MRVISFNIWGLPNASDRENRMVAIGKHLQELQPDLVGLQEAWWRQDHPLLTDYACQAGLCHVQFFPSGIAGSGLLTLSRYPIVETGFHLYSLSGKPEKFWQGDAYCGKGVSWSRIATPWGDLDFYNTHNLAQYGPDEIDEYPAHRAAQHYELVRYVRQISADRPHIITGDMNTRPDQFGYQLLTEYGRLQDAYAEANPGDHGSTVSPENPYQANQDAKRIDYILYQHGSQTQIEVQSATLTFQFQDMEKTRTFSDHFAVMADVTLTTQPPKQQDVGKSAESVLRTLRDMLGQGLAQAQQRRAINGLQSGAGWLSLPILTWISKQKRVSRRKFLQSMLWFSISTTAAVYATTSGLTAIFSDSSDVQSFERLIQDIDLSLSSRRL